MAVVRLTDGRQLGYQVVGDPGGVPVVALHGTPSSARQLAGLDEAARAHGVSLITPDRSGYGLSTHNPGRTIATDARDVGELVRALDVGACPVVGLSGGGPFALGCGVLLGDRVTAVATIGGVAPMVPRDASLPSSRIVGRLARRSEAGARAVFTLMLRRGRARPERTLEEFARLVAEPDARLMLDDGPIRAAFLDDLRHPSRSAARAAARDFWLFEHRWDVDIGTMAVPVHVWHGTDDRNVPVAHARLIARLCPTAQLHLVEGGGHLPLAQVGDVLALLR